MKILIPYQRVLRGGVTSFSFLLIRELLRSVDEIVVLLPKDEISFFETHVSPSPRLTLVAAVSLGDVRRIPGAGRLEIWLNHLRVRRLIERRGLTHCLCLDLGMFVSTVNCGLRWPIPVALVFHDLYWNLYQEGGKGPDRAQLGEWYAKLVARADVAIAVSRHTHEELLACVPDLSAKLRCVPTAAEVPAVPALGPRSSMTRADGCVFYYPAAAAGNKNHLLLFKAVKALTDKGLRLKVVLTGPGTAALCRDRDDGGALRADSARRYFLENRATLEGCVAALGYVDQEQVEACYADCDCVVLPSLYEGYGLPLTEALARGIPVICSDIPGFKEQTALYRCADWVRFFPSGDGAALASRLEEMLKAPASRISPEEVRERFKAWTPEDFSKGYIESLESAARVVS